MLIPVCCFSCGACIGHLWESYKQLVDQYNDQINAGKITPIAPLFQSKGYNSVAEVQKRLNNIDKLGKPSAEELAMITLNIKRMCCRRMFMTQSDTYQLVNLTK